MSAPERNTSREAVPSVGRGARLRLAAALLALTAGGAALVVAILLVRSALS